MPPNITISLKDAETEVQSLLDCTGDQGCIEDLKRELLQLACWASLYKEPWFNPNSWVKNWRPVFLLCADYNVGLSLANLAVRGDGRDHPPPPNVLYP